MALLSLNMNHAVFCICQIVLFLIALNRKQVIKQKQFYKLFGGHISGVCALNNVNVIHCQMTSLLLIHVERPQLNTTCILHCELLAIMQAYLLGVEILRATALL